MEKRINLFNLLRNEGQLKTLYVYAAQEVETDPYEHTKDLVMANPLPVKGLVRQVSFEALHWKYYGQLPIGSIEVIAEKKYLTHFRTADRIKYNDEYYKCWKDDAKGFAILERQDYIILILAKKSE
jgi:hypothetical protein